MKNIFLLILLFAGQPCWSQSAFADIKLEANTKPKSLPFQISSVQFTNQVSDTVGRYAYRKQETTAVWAKEKQKLAEQFLRASFIQSDTVRRFILEISCLRIAPVKVAETSSNDTFQFACSFRSADFKQELALYTFTASTRFGHPSNAKAALGDYISQSLTTAVEKFRESFIENAAWSQLMHEEKTSASMPVRVNLIRNQLADNDSVACESDRQLSWDDFSLKQKMGKTVSKLSDTGSGKYLLIYKVSAQETNDSILLTIHVKAFLHKANSWRPAGLPDSRWLVYQQGLYELCARYGYQLWNEIKNYPFSAGEYRSELNSIYNKINDEFLTKCRLYQSENGASLRKE